MTVSCKEKSNETYTVKTVDGVKYIHNHASVWGDEPKVALEFVKQIGDKENDDENYYLYNLADIARDADGNYYVLEVPSCIKVFYPDGKYKMSFGREGQGPGDISGANNITISVEDNIYVVDAGNSRIQVFSPNGEDMGSTRLNPMALSLRVLSNGEMVFRKRWPSPLDDKIGWARIVDPEGNIMHEFLKPDNELLKSEKRFSLAVDSDDNIYVSFTSFNRVEKYDSKGNIIFRTDRPLKYKAGAKIKRKIKYRSGRISKIDWINSVSRFIEVDSKGRVWIFSYSRQLKDFENDWEEEESYYSRYEFHIFDKNGIFLGKIPIKVFCKKFRIFGDRVYFIDSSKEICVHEYKIVEKY